MRRTLFPTLVLAGVLALSACGGGSGDAGSNDDAAAPAAGSASESVTIVGTEFEFSPTNFTLPAGEAVDLTLENTGVVEHDIVVEELDDLELVYAGPGESVTETVTVDAGTYTFYCSIPGHRAAGMEGQLTVE